MIWRAVRAVMACGMFAALAVPACGGSSSNSDTPTAGGNGGAGGGTSHAGGSGKSNAGAGGDAAARSPVPCGSAMCDGLHLSLLQDFDIPGCCADAATSSCGLDSSVLAAFGQTFTVACQPLAQSGTPDASCPASAAQAATGTVTIEFPGCCRANGTCGYQLDKIDNLIQIGLGCVDARPFLDGGTPATCGAGGEGGMGGAGPTEAGTGGALAGAGGA